MLFLQTNCVSITIFIFAKKRNLCTPKGVGQRRRIKGATLINNLTKLHFLRVFSIPTTPLFVIIKKPMQVTKYQNYVLPARNSNK